MCGNRCISGSSSQVFAILVGDVLAFTVFIALGEAEVDDEHIVSCGLCPSDQEVVRLDIAMNYSLLMHLFDSLDELLADKKNCFEVELAAAGREEVL